MSLLIDDRRLFKSSSVFFSLSSYYHSTDDKTQLFFFTVSREIPSSTYLNSLNQTSTFLPSNFSWISMSSSLSVTFYCEIKRWNHPTKELSFFCILSSPLLLLRLWAFNLLLTSLSHQILNGRNQVLWLDNLEGILHYNARFELVLCPKATNFIFWRWAKQALSTVASKWSIRNFQERIDLKLINFFLLVFEKEVSKSTVWFNC